MALLTLVVLVVAVPAGLLRFGDVPFAHARPDVVARVLSGRTTDGSRLITQWLSQGALLLAWLAWAWMTVCVVMEIKAWIGGRSARRLPASRTLQSLATCLVGTALALTALGRGLSVSKPTGASPRIHSQPSAPMIRVIDESMPFTEVTWDRSGGSDPSGHRSTGIPGRERPDSADSPRTGHPRAGVFVGGPAPDGAESASAAWPPLGNVDAVGGCPHPAVAKAPTPPSTAPTPTPPTSPTPTPPTPTPPEHWPVLPSVHLVKSRETLWSIATAKLGTALRWEEIAELNYGLRQADGGMLEADHWIRPGWRLLLPRDPEVPPSPDGSSVRGAESEHPGDEGLDRENHRLSDQPEPEMASVLFRPVGLPLWPELPGLASVTEPVDLARWSSAGSDGHRPRLAPDDEGGCPIEVPRGQDPPFTPVGAGVVGAGVVRMIDRMRRVQQRHRAEGRFIRLPDRPHAHLEQQLRLGEYGRTVDEVDRSLHYLMPSMRRSGRGVPIVEGVRVRPGVIELIVGDLGEVRDLEDVRASETLSSEVESRTLAVDRETLPPAGSGPANSAGRRGPAPLLVSAGGGPDGAVMVNLEFLGSLAVDGASSETEGFVRALALELATSHWSGQFELVVVGFGSELERFDRVTSVTDGPTLVHRLCRRQLSGREALRTTGFASFAQARWIEDSPRWDPIVVICGPQVADHLAAELVDCARDPRFGTAVIASGAVPGSRHVVNLSGDGRSLGLGRLGSVVFPQRVDSAEMQAVTTLLDTASSHEGVLASAEPYAQLTMPLPIQPTSDGIVLPRATVRSVPSTGAVPDQSAGVPEGTVEVAVLGPVEIRNAAREFARAWARELVVYLAMHPNGVSNEAWATALWPDRLMAPSSLHSTASVARRSLGQTPEGLDHLPRSHGRLALSPTVGTDWARFVALARSEDTAAWRSALDLVRGRPFEGLRASDWPILEGIGPAIESAVVDLSGPLAGACLRAGDPRGAEWSARRGLLVSPYDERLYRMLMRAADLGGNPAGVEAVMSELVRLVADDVEPLDSVHPSTMELYRSLTRRNSLPGSGGG